MKMFRKVYTDTDDKIKFFENIEDGIVEIGFQKYEILFAQGSSITQSTVYLNPEVKDVFVYEYKELSSLKDIQLKIEGNVIVNDPFLKKIFESNEKVKLINLEDSIDLNCFESIFETGLFILEKDALRKQDGEDNKMRFPIDDSYAFNYLFKGERKSTDILFTSIFLAKYIQRRDDQLEKNL